MTSNGFELKCNNCGNEVRLIDDTSNSDYKKNNYSFYSIQNERINITCNKCNNEVYIDQ